MSEHALTYARQNDYTITPSCTTVAASAQDIVSQCTWYDDTIETDMTGGQVLNDAGWNVIIRWDWC